MNADQQSADQSPMGNPRVHRVSESTPVPGVVRVYGMIIMVLNGILAVLTALQALLLFVASKSPLLLVLGALGIAINFVWFRLGKGLRTGERQAVYGLCIFGGLAVLAGVCFLVMGQAARGLITLVGVAALNAPPIASAVTHWTAFK